MHEIIELMRWHDLENDARNWRNWAVAFAAVAAMFAAMRLAAFIVVGA